MNTLSWLLYAGEVSGSLKDAGVAIVIFGLVGLLGWTAASFGSSDLNDEWPSWGVKRRWLFVPVFGAFLTTIAPSQKTVYMIAASEMGERVVQTEEAREVYDLLRKKVREVLK